MVSSFLPFELRRHQIQAIVLDIEGTTTPIGFVYDVLFPFARTHLCEYLDHADAEHLHEPIRRLRAEWSADVAQGTGPPHWSPAHEALPGPRPQVPGPRPEAQEAQAYVEWLMDRDRKSPGLKLLQGQIWEQGYAAGLLHGEVFPDVPPALQRWRDTGIAVAIYSSGSTLAQRLLFGSTRQGDLTALISRFFDTEVGAKVAAESYTRIGRELACPVDQLLFVSDVWEELNAAREAGCQAVLCVRPGNRPQPTGAVDVIETFDEIV
jgi:enolase-phosphatase E1